MKTDNTMRLEEKLISAELSIYKELKQENILVQLDSLIAKYDGVPEKLSCTLQTSETLGKHGKFILPLQVKGKMLGVGRHKIRYYPEEELKKAVKKYQGRVIPMKLDHRKKEASSTIGVVTRIFWLPAERAIGYEGHINDETMARNVLDTVVHDVSATIFSTLIMDDVFGEVGLDLDFGELSIVEDGAYEGNSIQAVM